MAITPKQELHALIDRLDDDQARRMAATLRRAAGPTSETASPRLLTEADILLALPILPGDETADEMIATVRDWRREGGYA